MGGEFRSATRLADPEQLIVERIDTASVALPAPVVGMDVSEFVDRLGDDGYVVGFTAVALLIGASIGGCSGRPTEPTGALTFRFDFSREPQGFVAGFADYPPDHADSYELTSGYRALPPPLEPEYLQERITTLLGRQEWVVVIHGAVGREERLAVQEAFRHDPQVQVLLATDAAGEGINLQRAHLMVNYDLPWNPNRLEQRFGRIHRIGQTEVCHLWNLVADDTREGDVYRRLLEKLGTPAEFARRCGRSAKLISEIIAGKAPIEPRTAPQRSPHFTI